eukprot:1388324-Amphidinium_carterae.3
MPYHRGGRRQSSSLTHLVAYLLFWMPRTLASFDAPASKFFLPSSPEAPGAFRLMRKWPLQGGPPVIRIGLAPSIRTATREGNFR